MPNRLAVRAAAGAGVITAIHCLLSRRSLQLCARHSRRTPMRTASIRSAPWLALAFAATILFGATTTRAQKDSSQGQKASSPGSTPVELTGCVSGRPAADGTFTLTDAQNGGKYRLT